MAKRGLKIFGIGAGTLIVVVGIIVGILIATGVIKTKQEPAPPSEVTPTSDGGSVMPPSFFCKKAPRVTSFSPNNGKYTLYFTPGMEGRCVNVVDWWYDITFKANNGQSFGNRSTFNAFANQNSIDIDLGQPFGPTIKSVEGEVSIVITAKGRPWEVIAESNKYNYSFSV